MCAFTKRVSKNTQERRSESGSKEKSRELSSPSVRSIIFLPPTSAAKQSSSVTLGGAAGSIFQPLLCSLLSLK